MDNLSVHHVSEILDLFHLAGILVLFLPPHSPDLTRWKRHSVMSSHIYGNMNFYRQFLTHKLSSDLLFIPLQLTTVRLGFISGYNNC